MRRGIKKKVLGLGMVVVFVLSLTACGAKTCKVKGCQETTIYDDGYCRYHYYENLGSNIMKDILN